MLRKWYLFFLIMFVAAQPPVAAETNNEVLHADIVFCLDLSGSTNGLVDNFREQIWSLVNMTSHMKPGIHLRIGIVGYSRPSFGKDAAYVKILSQPSGNYDQVASVLWELRPEVERGDQFVSNALSVSAFKINWTREKNNLKIIYLVGNGSVNTGTSDYRSVATEIKKNGIMLVPVYCQVNKKTNNITGWNILSEISGQQLESVWISKRQPVIKAVPDGGKLQEALKEIDRLALPFTNEGVEAFKAVKVSDLGALAFEPASFQNRLFYRVSDSLLKQVQTYDLCYAAEGNPELAVSVQQEIHDKSLRKLSPAELYAKIGERRKRQETLIANIKKLLPKERQEYINQLISAKEFETNEILERVILRKSYMLLSGLRDHVISD